MNSGQDIGMGNEHSKNHQHPHHHHQQDYPCCCEPFPPHLLSSHLDLSQSLFTLLPTTMLPSVILDIQCFRNNRNEFIVKEATILEVYTGTILFHHVAKLSPSMLDDNNEPLTEAKQRENKWLTKNYHGLNWTKGDTPYDVMLSKLQERLANRYIIYVKGSEKKMFVLNHLLTASSTDCFDEVDSTSSPSQPAVMDLGDIGCESLSSLKSNFTPVTIGFTLRCNHHKSTTHQCALTNCILLRNWLINTARFRLSSIINETF